MGQVKKGILIFALSLFSLLSYPSGSSGGNGGSGSISGAPSSGGSSGSALGSRGRSAKINLISSIREKVRKKLLEQRGSVFFDPGFKKFNALYGKHIYWKNKKERQSFVDYKNIDKKAVEKYNKEMTKVSRKEVGSWSREKRYAYYINLYNSLTIERILRSYPLNSIKNLNNGKGPWDEKFFTLFGKKMGLNEIEHVIVRGGADFDEPRLHFAFNCASIGCPALAPYAFDPRHLDQQLELATQRFLKDRSRNYFDTENRTLYVSLIFKWYKKDFEKGHQGIKSLKAFFRGYAKALGTGPQERELIAQGQFRIAYNTYDWGLNDLERYEARRR